MSSISLIRKGPGAVLHTSAMVMAILRMAVSCKHRQNPEYGPPASTSTDGLARFSVIIVPLMIQILLISRCYCQLSIASRISFVIVLLNTTSFVSTIMWFVIIYHVAVQTLASKQLKSVLQHAHSVDKALTAVCIRCLVPDLFSTRFCEVQAIFSVACQSSKLEHFLDGSPLLVIVTVQCNCYSVFFGICGLGSCYCTSGRAPKVFAIGTQYAKASTVIPTVQFMPALLVPSSFHHETLLANNSSIKTFFNASECSILHHNLSEMELEALDGAIQCTDDVLMTVQFVPSLPNQLTAPGSPFMSGWFISYAPTLARNRYFHLQKYSSLVLWNACLRVTIVEIMCIFCFDPGITFIIASDHNFSICVPFVTRKGTAVFYSRWGNLILEVIQILTGESASLGLILMASQPTCKFIQEGLCSSSSFVCKECTEFYALYCCLYWAYSSMFVVHCLASWFYGCLLGVPPVGQILTET